MASIFTAAKSMISKITDDLNKDKWDKNCINTALFTDPEPGKMVPPNRNGAKDDGGTPALAVAGADAVAVAEPAPDVPIVAPAPQIDYGKSEPQVKQTAAVPEEPKKEPVRFVNPRFSRAMPYVTSKVKKPEDGVRSLSDLPKVDPSQSISNITSGGTLPGEEEEAAPAPAAVSEVEAAPAPAAVSEVEAAPAAAPAAEAVSVPEYTPEAAPAAVVPEYTPAPAAEAVSVPEYTPAPAAETIAVAEAAAAEPAPVEAAEAAPAAAEEEEKCYYVLITHRKIYPEKGSRIMMRNCDSQYAWTDSVDESKKPTFPTCPVCGKTIEYIETEMD